MTGILKKILTTTLAMCICLVLIAQTNSDISRQCDSITSIAEKETDVAKLATLYNQLAYRYLALGDDQKLISSAEKSLSYARQKELDNIAFDDNLLLGRVYARTDKPEDALHCYLSAQSLVDRKTPEGLISVADIGTEIGFIYFDRKHYNRAAENFYDALKVYDRAGLPDKIKQNTNHLAVCAYLTENYHTALKYYNSLLDIYTKEGDKDAQKQIMRRIADIYQKQKQYDKALEINNRLYDMCATDNDADNALNALNNIAYCQVALGESEKAINSFRQIVETDMLKAPTDEQLANAYTNIGLCYQNMGKDKECYDYLESAAEIYRKNDQHGDFSRVYNIIAIVYLKNKDLHNAETYCKEAIDAAELSGNPILQEDAYLTYKDILRAKGDFDTAMDYYQKYLSLRDSSLLHNILDGRALSDDLHRLEDAEKRFSEEISDAEITDLTNRQLKLMADAKEAENKLMRKDLELQEIQQARLRQELALQRQQREAEQRANEILLLQQQQQADSINLAKIKVEEELRQQEIDNLETLRDNQEKELKLERQGKQVRNLIISLFGVVLAVMVAIFILVRKKNAKLHQQKIEIEEKNADLLQKNEEIVAQKLNLEAANIEIMQVNEEVTRQKEVIESKNKSITDSIVYAKRIQQAVCPPPTFLHDLNLDYFLFFRPKEIVSGDFYWFYHEGDIVFCVAADCTGHGVPGAFMSMLGNSLFTKIITERKIYAPDQILNNLRAEVKRALHQENINSARKDGMDLSLLKLNTKTLLLEFAAANNNGYLLRRFDKSQEALANADLQGRDQIRETSDGFLRLITLRADKMPIGVYIRDHLDFSSQTVQLQHGDTIYLTSDGYIDQFGGNGGHKFMSSNFTKMLMDINPLSMDEQQNVVIETHEKWMGDTFPQLDDIIVFGLRI